MDKERYQMLAGVIISAVEGGSNYWAEFEAYKWKDGHDFTLENVSVKARDGKPDDEICAPLGKWSLITPDAIETAMLAIRDGKGNMHHTLRAEIVGAYYTNDEAGNIDADLADIIMQMAVLGSVIYG